MKFLRRAAHVVCLVALAVVAERSVSSQTNPHQTAGDKSKKAAGQQQTPAPPVVNVTVVAPQKPADQLKTEADNAAKQETIQKRIATYTGALVLVGVLDLFALTVGLAYSIRAANAAKTAADAATKSADVAFQSLAITQRGHLTISKFQPAAGDELTMVHFALSINGNTAVTVESGEIRMSIDEPPTPQSQRLDGSFTRKIQPVKIVPSNEAVQAVNFAPLTPEQRNVWSNSADGLKIFFSGDIRYRDAFKGTPRHRKHFGYVVTVGRGEALNPRVRNDEEDDE